MFCQPLMEPAENIEETKQRINKVSKYLIYFSSYMCTMLFVIGHYCILKNLILMAIFCVVYLFGHLIYSKSVQQKSTSILRLYQIFYALFLLIITIIIVIKLIDLFNGKRLNYIWFFIWLLLVVPTLATIYFIHKYIQLINKSNQCTALQA